jgi:hypothetical protein
MQQSKTKVTKQKVELSYASVEKKPNLDPGIKRKKLIHLICINPGGPDEDTGLEFLARYSASGTVRCDNGDLCYVLNDWEEDGCLKKVERFIIPKNLPEN